MIRNDDQCQWRGGTFFEVVMNVVWDCFNNWGLREGFNDAATYTIVPWYARAEPTKANSAGNRHWGMAAIEDANPVAVNAMWQTSASDDGPRTRSMEAWQQGSLVRELVTKTLRRCEKAKQSGVLAKGRRLSRAGVIAERSAPVMAGESMVCSNTMKPVSVFFTDVEKYHYTQVHIRTYIHMKCKH